MYNKEIIPKWDAIENERKRLKAEKLEQKIMDKETKPKDEIEEMMSDSDLDDESGSDKDVDEDDPDVAKNPRIKSLNKNLRSRQDTAKYLQNIRDKAAHYDGKSRAMRGNPNEINENDQNKLYKGDNYNIYSGKYFDLMDQENFTKDAEEKGNVELNSVAMPSQAELAFKQFQQKKDQMKSQVTKELYEKYGGEEHADIPDEVKLNALKEQYENANKAIAAQNKKKAKIDAKSRYEEDLLKNGHTSVWGSFWHPHFGWGYK